MEYKNSDCIVLGIPSGGVPVASQIASALNLQIDVIIVRKIQIPYNTEAGFGAMGPDGDIIFNERLLAHLSLSEDEIKMQIEKTRETIKNRNRLFRGGRPFPPLKDKCVIIVDDGLASGYTMLAAVNHIRRKNPLKIVIAVPTGSKRTVNSILPEVDELFCMNVRSGFPFAVADAYRNWYDINDDEVLDVLKSTIK